MTTPIPSTRQGPPTSFRNPTTLEQPIDTSFLRLSVTSTTPSERLSTWSFHPSDSPGVSSGGTGSGSGSGSGSSGVGAGVGGRSSVGTFGPSSPPHNDVDSLGRKKQSTPNTGDDGGIKKEDTADDMSPVESKEDRVSQLPGTVQKYNRASRQPHTSPTGKHQHVHFGHKPSQSMDQGYPSILRHRPAASTSLLETITSTGTGISQSPSTQLGQRMRTRSKSIDSISLHPSIADSATDLLDPSHGLGGRLPLVHSHSTNIPRDLVSRNDLPPNQRAILLRRAKKLEQLLGQSLDERSIERLLIDPIQAHRTIDTRSKLGEEAWPDSPTRAGREEWQRDDCVPRKGRLVDAATPTTTQHVGLGLARSGSFLARTARAALGLSKTGVGAGDGKKGDLAVYVSREIRVSETGGRPVARHSASTPAEVNLSKNTTSPVSPMLEREEEGSESDEGEDEAARRTRRLQLAKLHRLLGVPIPPDLVQRHSSGTDRESTETTTSAEHSFMLMEDNIVTPSPSWTAMLKNTLSLVRSREGKNKRSSSPVPPRSVSRSESYVDMAISGGGTMNEKEKAVARKKAQKLEYMFGDTPPQNMFLPARSVTPDQSSDPVAASTSTASQSQGLRTRQTSHGSFVAYQQSLTNLLYLADNDTATLDILMDKLDEDSDPEQEEARQRRKRTGKLTHFFGETGIDFDDPPNVESTMERVRSRTNTLRKDTLDEMMREMWRGVQAEVRRGGMAVKDGEKLGEMIDKLRIRRGGQGRGQWEVL